MVASRYLLKLHSGCLLDLQSPLKAQPGIRCGDLYQTHSQDCGQDSVTHWLFHLGPQLLTVDWRPPSVSCHVALSIGQISTWQLASLRVSEQVMYTKAFCNLILEVTHCSFCLILFARSISKSNPHSRRGIAKEHEQQGWIYRGPAQELPRLCHAKVSVGLTRSH